MAYDESLAERIRERLRDEPDVTERKMFGGLGFMAGSGHMAVAAASQGALMVRVDPDETAELVSRPGVERMVMQGRSLNGWLLVDASALADDEELREWVDRGVDYARSLPAKD